MQRASSTPWALVLDPATSFSDPNGNRWLLTRSRPGDPAGMRRTDMDIASLADLLHETSERHGSFEAVAPPHNWWDWYAAYLHARRSSTAPDEAAAGADRYMAEVKHVVVAQ
jgi:hypothetical protein